MAKRISGEIYRPNFDISDYLKTAVRNEFFLRDIVPSQLTFDFMESKSSYKLSVWKLHIFFSEKEVVLTFKEIGILEKMTAEEIHLHVVAVFSEEFGDIVDCKDL